VESDFKITVYQLLITSYLTTMSFFDLILLIALLLFAGAGYRFGLIHAVGSLVGLALGLVIAGKIYEPVAIKAVSLFGGQKAIVGFIAYLVIFFVINRLIGLAFWFFEKFYNVIGIIPGLRLLNHSLGALLGLIEGVLGLGVVFHLVGRFPFLAFAMAPIARSQLAQWILSVSAVLLPLLPQAFRSVSEVDWEAVRRLTAFPGGAEALKSLSSASGAGPLVDHLRNSAGPKAVELFAELQKSFK